MKCHTTEVRKIKEQVLVIHTRIPDISRSDVRAPVYCFSVVVVQEFCHVSNLYNVCKLSDLRFCAVRVGVV